MITLVTARLWPLDIVLHRQDIDVALPLQHLGDPVYISCKGTDDPDSGDIIDIPDHVVDRRFITVFFQFLHDTFRSLDPRLDMFYGIVLMHMLKLVIQDLELGSDLL